jgi:hypothetical protein
MPDAWRNAPKFSPSKAVRAKNLVVQANCLHHLCGPELCTTTKRLFIPYWSASLDNAFFNST